MNRPTQPSQAHALQKGYADARMHRTACWAGILAPAWAREEAQRIDGTGLAGNGGETHP
jgi:hypothetical protein